MAESTGSGGMPWEGLEGHDLHAACLTAARAGDRRAMNRLVAELSPLVWHVARGNGLDAHAAEDVVQTVWLTLLRRIGEVGEPRALAAWLITTTRREALRAGRRAEALTLTDDVADAAAGAHPPPEDVVLRAERDRSLWRAFRGLSTRCQELLRLTVLAGKAEYRYVADALGMPHGSIGPTRSRCLARMRELLSASRPDPTEGQA
ncbi:RNA polymerase sigma factor [Prauserella rugosa]|uniref:RNA polymerase sigma factor (Sigma-70 family) n=1 Tax=Prauserella rugosa TaxID=43354 RepID=A0A660CI33_9PSEU|nr:sigma-70 family RNA polymerase sigma factor [Prauserella rugosa]KMS84048.1 RNA polymerase sigma factor [Streptomyces regensis]TWH21293.1 RNA polymerase sigma factor (sigma-70 family) [Prauserella rugosa]